MERRVLQNHMRANDYLQRFKNSFGMLVIGRETASQVFYDLEYFCRRLSSLIFHVLSVTEGAYWLPNSRFG
jgi:hypothetical protein